MTTPTTVSVRLQLRADTAANWTSANPTLLANELGRETDTGKIKIGDGSTAWSSLAYQAWATLPIAVASGGTGQTSYTNGQLLIGNTTGNTLTKATLTAGSGIAITNGSGSITVAASGIADAQIAADAEIAVSKLADGAARQLLQTDAAGTGVEWASNIDIPGTLDVTSAATFDSTIGASAGTASLPSITFTGDLNTGIYSPGADQVAISTNGSGRLFVDSSGRVGVGASAPQSQLQVLDQLRISNSSQSQGSIVLGDGGSSLFNVGIARWNGGSNSAGAGGIGYFSQGTTNIGGHYFYTGDAVAGSQTPRLVITPGGAVGIGVTSPSTSLHVGGSSDQSVQINGSGTAAFVGTSTAVAQISSNRNPTTGAIYDSGRAVSYINLEASSGNGNIQFYTTATNNVNATERARIDSAGRLLVGTSSYAGNGKLIAAGNTGGNAGTLDICWTGSRPTAADTDIGYIRWYSVDNSSGNAHYASIYASSDGASSSGSDIPGRLVFSTTADGASSPTERMRITSAGDVGIGSTNPTGSFGNGNGIQLSPVGACLLNRTSGPSGAFGRNTTTGDIITFNYGSTTTNPNQVGSISVTASATAYNTSSDYRLKENVQNVTDGINRLQQLKPSRFTFIAEPDKTVDGFIAHEVQSVVPEAITGEKDAVDDEGNPVYQGIDQSKLVPLLTAALQEAVARIEQLEAAVATLQGS